MGNIYGNGIHQGDLYTLLAAIVTSFNAMCTELTTDTNGTFTGTAYDVTLNVNSKVCADARGLSNDIIYAFLKDFIDKWNTLMTALDSTDLTATDYDPTVLITDSFDSQSQLREIKATGVYQGDLVWLLNHIITQIAACTVKLDADGLCAGYATAYDITDTVDTTIGVSHVEISS